MNNPFKVVDNFYVFPKQFKIFICYSLIIIIIMMVGICYPMLCLIGIVMGGIASSIKPEYIENFKLLKNSLFDDEGRIDFNKFGLNVLEKPIDLESYLKSNFTDTADNNPYGNVLITEILDNPKRKPALPSFNNNVDADILDKTKNFIQTLNPTLKNSNKQLFGDIYDKFTLNQYNRVFYTTPNTEIPNNQEAYIKYLYGGMNKEKNKEQIK
jgi:hypothetical protein